MSCKVTTGKNASIFHDQSTGITVKKGEVVTLTNAQYQSRRVKAALNGGHLVIAVDGITNTEPKYSVEERTNTIKDMVKNGIDVKKIKKAFTMQELSDIASSMDIEVESGDTKDTLVQAIVEEFTSES